MQSIYTLQIYEILLKQRTLFLIFSTRNRECISLKIGFVVRRLQIQRSAKMPSMGRCPISCQSGADVAMT